jgi:hypothetical protein
MLQCVETVNHFATALRRSSKRSRATSTGNCRSEASGVRACACMCARVIVRASARACVCVCVFVHLCVRERVRSHLSVPAPVALFLVHARASACAYGPVCARVRHSACELGLGRACVWLSSLLASNTPPEQTLRAALAPGHADGDAASVHSSSGQVKAAAAPSLIGILRL